MSIRGTEDLSWLGKKVKSSRVLEADMCENGLRSVRHPLYVSRQRNTFVVMWPICFQAPQISRSTPFTVYGSTWVIDLIQSSAMTGMKVRLWGIA